MTFPFSLPVNLRVSLFLTRLVGRGAGSGFMAVLGFTDVELTPFPFLPGGPTTFSSRRLHQVILAASSHLLWDTHYSASSLHHPPSSPCRVFLLEFDLALRGNSTSVSLSVDVKYEYAKCQRSSAYIPETSTLTNLFGFALAFGFGFGFGFPSEVDGVARCLPFPFDAALDLILAVSGCSVSESGSVMSG
jgi:hypothetical protein